MHTPRSGTPTAQQQTKSSDFVPETATRERTPEYDNFHTGRGGQGNIHKDKYGGHSKPQDPEQRESLVEKAKHVIGLDKHEKKAEGSPLKQETGGS